MEVIKRNGSVVDFDREKIFKAIAGAVTDIKDYSITEENINEMVDDIYDILREEGIETIHIECLQDIVEETLMAYGYTDTARAYIKYRQLHKMARDNYKDLMDEVAIKLDASQVQNQNANVDEHSFGGRMGEVNRLVMKRFALENCMSEMAKNNHLNNMIYIHDLDSYAAGMHNCLSIPFDKLLAEGFNTRQTDVRPANSVNTAFQLVAVIFQLQSLQQFGGVSATHLDWTMVPYVRKSFWKHYKDGLVYAELNSDYQSRAAREDIYYIIKEDWSNLPINDRKYIDDIYDEAYEYAMEMTKKEIHQAVEGMYHNLNTLQSRSGNQLPFTSINYGTCTLPEGRLVTQALLEVSLEGIGKLKKTPIFPCGIFQCMKGVNQEEGDPNYDLFKLAIKSTAKRLYPNYANVDWSGNAGYDRNDPRTYFSTMGCRTANGYDVNGFGQLKDGRGNICPVTIIMPTLAMEAMETAELNYQDHQISKETWAKRVFIDILSQKIDEAKDMLIERFEWICSQNPASAKFMYENGTMEGYVPEEGIRSALKHGTLAIGQLGLAETLQILIGEDHTTEKGMELAKKIEQLFKDKCAQFKEEYKLNFGVYYTPAENLCYTAMKKFQDKYGIIPNVSDKEFFTNSIHVPVWKEVSPFEKIDIESQLTGYSSAGCITYVEFDSSVQNNLSALEKIVKYAMDHDIPYFAVNVPNDTCLKCGYTDQIEDCCPDCGGTEIQSLKRVTGYLTGDYKTAFNLGKQQEVEMRYQHSKKLGELN